MKAKTAKLYHWATEKANSKRASLWIGLLFSLEIFLFIPLDAILMFFCLQNRQKIFYYVSIAALASLFSACLGYFLGHFLWEWIGPYIVPQFMSLSFFTQIGLHFQQYESWAVFLGALLPFPLKALSLTAGVFHLPLLPFICCLAAARLLRFMIVGAAMVFLGEKVKTFIDQHFHYIILLIAAKLALAIGFFWIVAQT
jgi:membrane protein YqaA with SNARE-associated domain